MEDDSAGETGADTTAMIFDALAAVAPEVRTVAIDPTVDLWKALHLDSMDVVTVVERLSSAIGADIPERDLPRLISIDGIRSYLAERTRPG